METQADAAVLGARFAESVAGKDKDGGKAVLHPGIEFRGMTPGRSWEASNPQEVTEILFDNWFEDHDRIERLVSCESEPVSTRNHLTYRFEVTNGSEDFIVEQHAFYEVLDGKISWLRVMCSGFLPR
jgi:hypothetical protein